MLKKIEITIDDSRLNSKGEPKNRDHGKTFVITEMPAIPAATWADRVLLILSRSNLNLPQAKERGIAGLVQIGFAALPTTNYPEMQPLLAELLTCVQIKTGIGIVRAIQSVGDVEEIATVYRLRQEVFMLHADFFLDGLPSIRESDKPVPTTSSTPTSPPPLGQSFRQGKRRSQR